MHPCPVVMNLKYMMIMPIHHEIIIYDILEAKTSDRYSLTNFTFTLNVHFQLLFTPIRFLSVYALKQCAIGSRLKSNWLELENHHEYDLAGASLVFDDNKQLFFFGGLGGAIPCPLNKYGVGDMIQTFC